MDIFTFNNICRTCTSKNESLLSVFDIQISDTNTVQMVEFLNKLTSIEITKDDGLSQFLCMCCIDTICKVYNFIQMCKESDTSLRIRHESVAENLIKEEQIASNQSTDLNIEEVGTPHVVFEVKHLKELESIVIDQPTKNVSMKNDKSGNIKTEAKVLNETVEETSIHQCEKCDEVFGTKLDLSVHKVTHKPDRYECKECLKTFLKKTQLNMHIRSHNNVQDKQHVCKVCGQAFNYSYLLNQHSFKHKDEKPFPCTKCKKGCLTAESLRRHMKIHEEGYKKKIHTCPICGKEFQYPSFLSEHMKNHTGEKPFLCSICGKGFRQSGALDYHIRSHTGYKPFKCDICHNSFTCRGVLRVHMRRHTDERPYICDICGVGFRQSTDMKRHRSTHSGDKRALCTICGKQISTTGQLTIHLRSHTGEKPFGCEVCQKAFTTRTMLVKHQRIHTGERPYTCKICGRSFNQSGTLKTHAMVHIKNNQANLENSKSKIDNSVSQNGNKTKSELLLMAPTHLPPSIIST